MQKLIIILSAVLLITMAASADARGRGGQGGPGAKGLGAGNGGSDRRAQFQQQLNLSDEQVSQMREIRQNGGSRDEIHAVLNDEQRAMVNEHRSEMTGRGGRGGQRGNGHGRQGRGNPVFENEQASAEGGEQGK